MENTIIYKSNKREFDNIAIGEFFMDGQNLYIKINSDVAFDLNYKTLEEFNGWADVTEPKVTITVEV